MGVELQNPGVDPDRRLAAMRERRAQADKEHDRRVKEGPSRRKIPHSGVLENIAEQDSSKARSGSIQENAPASRAAQEGKQPDNNPERIIETRAEKARRAQTQTDQSATAPPQGMKLRDTAAGQERAQRNQDGNTRSGPKRGGRGRAKRSSR